MLCMRKSDVRVTPRNDHWRAHKTILLIVGFKRDFDRLEEDLRYDRYLHLRHCTRADDMRGWHAGPERPIYVWFQHDWAYLKESERIMEQFQGFKNEWTFVVGIDGIAT